MASASEPKEDPSKRVSFEEPADVEAQKGSETDPLLEKTGTASTSTTYSGGKRVPSEKLKTVEHRGFTFKNNHPGHVSSHGPMVERNEVRDAMTYHTQDLASWNSLYNVSFTVWNRRSLWLITLKLFGLSTVVALLVLAVTANPATLRVSKFTEISNFLRVFVGLLLGFFMSASVNRWWACAQGFQNLCAAVRSLQIYLCALGVSKEPANQCLRYGVLSAWILHMQLHIEACDPKEQRAAIDEGWQDIAAGKGRDDLYGQVLPEELDMLHSASDPSGQLWMWVGSMLGHLAEEGHIPPVASPTYGRFMGIALDGFNAIRDVRSSISVQAPFIYVQMLSSLVHINNIVNAISFGLTWGASLGTMLVHLGVKVFEVHDEAKASERQAATDMQTLLVSFFFSCFGPFVYQALLEVSIAIAQPFSNKDAVVPTERILHLLERDLHDGMKFAKHISWKPCCFKK